MSGLGKNEIEVRDNAVRFARENRQQLAKILTDKSRYPPEEEPVSVFMAGSPGAGKTETSKALLAWLGDESTMTLRIDPDDYRDYFPGYSGSNSWLFQSASSLIVERVIDLALKQKQSFILDGTLSSYDVACRNIERCLRRKRFVQILYVYQEPQLAWQFVQAREQLEGRRILPGTFITQFLTARSTVNALKLKFEKNIRVDILLKDHDGANRSYESNVDVIDSHLPKPYSRHQLERILGTTQGYNS